MKNRLTLLILIISISFCIHSCIEKTKITKQTEAETVVSQIQAMVNSEKTNISRDTIEDDESLFPSKVWEVKEGNYAFTAETLEYIEYDIEEKPEKVTDFETVKKRLEGVVEFNESGTVPKGVSEIHFKNGKVAKALPDDINFVAYYPNEDVILFENPAGLDVSYNLNNGEEVELTGNPEYWVVSEDKQYRLNGYLNSNDCITYFIQKKVNGVYKNVIPLSDVFEKNEEFRLCQIKHAFWANKNETLYIEESFFDEPSNTYRMTISKAELESTNSKTSASKELINFVPDGYVIYNEIYGDLNNDSVEDCAVMIKGTDTSKIVQDEYYPDKKSDLNRRGIIILFKRDDKYELAVKNYDCFSSGNENGGGYYPPELDVYIKKGNLYAHFAHGRYGYWTHTFRYQNSDFELIGYDDSNNNGPIALSKTSINFSTKKKIEKVTIKPGSEEYEDHPNYQDKTSTLKLTNLIQLSNIKDFDELRDLIYNLESN